MVFLVSKTDSILKTWFTFIIMQDQQEDFHVVGLEKMSSIPFPWDIFHNSMGISKWNLEQLKACDNFRSKKTSLNPFPFRSISKVNDICSNLKLAITFLHIVLFQYCYDSLYVQTRSWRDLFHSRINSITAMAIVITSVLSKQILEIFVWWIVWCSFVWCHISYWTTQYHFLVHSFHLKATSRLAILVV